MYNVNPRGHFILCIIESFLPMLLMLAREFEEVRASSRRMPDGLANILKPLDQMDLMSVLRKP